MGSDKRSSHVGQGKSGLGSQLVERLDRLQFRLDWPRCSGRMPGVRWRSGGHERIGPSRQPSATQRTIRKHAHPVTLCGRKHGALNGPGEDRVAGLLGPESMMTAPFGYPLRLDHEVGREGG